MADGGNPHDLNRTMVPGERPTAIIVEQQRAVAGNLRPFKPGQSGNPAGRPKGSRNRLAEAFVSELCEDFERHGRSVIEDVRRSDPVAYLAICAKLVPKDFATAADKPGKARHEYTNEELLEIIEGAEGVVQPVSNGTIAR